MEYEKEAKLERMDAEFVKQMTATFRRDEGISIPLDPARITVIWPKFNSERAQRCTATLDPADDGRFQQWTGIGEDNDQAEAWRVRGFSEVVIKIEHQRDNGFVDSALRQRRPQGANPNPTIYVFGENDPGSANPDWNDTIVYIVPSL